MRTVTGILEWPDRAEARVRQLVSNVLVHRPDDPLMPAELGARFNLRPGLEVTVEVVDRVPQHHHGGGRPHQGGGGGGGHRGGRHGGRHGGRDQWRDSGSSAPRAVVEQILAIEGREPGEFAKAKRFEDLTVIDPQPRLTLEYPGCPASCRLIDLFCPIGRGQRGLIVSPPKAGKTTLLKDIATAVLRNHPDVEVVLLLIDERPEEVTEFRRSFGISPPPRSIAAAADAARGAGGEPALNGKVGDHGHIPAAEDEMIESALKAAVAGTDKPWDPARVRIIASSNDHDTERHVSVSMMALERAKRRVEAGKHVLVILDSLTRLGRAFNRSGRHASSGRTMTGGIDSKALEIPRAIFGAARNTEDGGSLTIIASALVDTGSAGDQVIFEEFKGTGNMELILDRKVSERRLFPAINLAASGTRKEDLLLSEQELKTMTALRRRMLTMPPPAQVEQLLAALSRFPTNAGLVGSTANAPARAEE
jgi:transcription termination factor Rho